MTIGKFRLVLAVAAALLASTAVADTYTDNFQGTHASLKWTALGNACLTAGDGTGSIPRCGSTYQDGATYAVPADERVADPTTNTGQGALMLTPAHSNQTGAILSGFPPFPLSQGIQITFTTYTFGGSHDGTGGNGADGIVFFLTDGTKDPPTATGAEGGSMGYSCSNTNHVYDGIAYGYLGLGIDEWGNYLNSGDNTNTGILNSNASGGSTAHGTNPFWDGEGNKYYQPERIGLRGAGNTNMAGLALMPGASKSYYSGSANYVNGVENCNGNGKKCSATTGNKVIEACRSGKYVTAFETTTKGGITYQVTSSSKPIDYNYNAIPGGYAILPGDKSQGNVPSVTNQPIANNSGSATRNPTSSTKAADVAWPITYKLTISPTGLLNFDYSYNNGAYQTVLANHQITDDNGPLPDSLRFGFSAGTGGSWNVHEITCFTASPLQSQSSAGANTESGKTIGDIQFFLASYSQNNWWGSLVANPLQQVGDTLVVGTAANWDAKCVLTGAKPCDAMTDSDGKTTDVTVQSPASRTLLTSKALGAGSGVTMQWANLGTTQQNALNVATANNLDATPGQNRVAWLRGNRGAEQLAAGCTSTNKASPTCDLRARTYVLGDIINSSPTFVGAPGVGAQPQPLDDKLYTSESSPENADGAQKYSEFVTSNAARTNVVYIGGNDGYVHGFRAGATKSDGSFDATSNDGKELIGYMPYDVLVKQAVNLADPLYKHDYLVDATPVAGDVFYDEKWHTWLVGGVGSGGSEIYALDVTDPTSFSSANPKDIVIGDWDNDTLDHLGTTVGTPVIARMHNGQWAILLGSGLVPKSTGGATAPTQGVYIGLIDSSGSVTFQFLDTKVQPTGVGDAAGGISDVSQVDLDGDGISDYLYAGDTQGRVWRFDVTSTKASEWAVSSYNGGSNPLFTAKDGSGNAQPITTAIMPLSVRTGLATRVMLYFGTGQQTPQSASASITYTKGKQTFYGIWDWNMEDWNGKSTVAKYKSLTGNQTIAGSSLLAQKVDGTRTDATHRYLSSTDTVCWKGDTHATSCSDQFGWMFDLPDKGPTSGSLLGQQEQIIYSPTFIGGAVVVNSAIPPTISAAQCNPGLQSGWTMAFNPATGGGFTQGFFPDAGGGYSSGTSTVGGLMLSGVGTPTSLQYNDKKYLVTQTITGAAKIIGINPPSDDNPSRVSWRELVTP